MRGLLSWVGNILFFLIFVTMIENLLPGKQYSRYVRLSAGMVLILLVLKPVTEGLRLEDQIRLWFETFSFQQEARDFSKDILGMERQRLARVMDSYEQTVEEDVKAMAEEMGVVVVSAQVSIERDEEQENYGAVTHIQMEVKWDGEADGGEVKEEGEREAVQAVNPVSPVEKVAVSLTGQGGDERAEAEADRRDKTGGEAGSDRGSRPDSGEPDSGRTDPAGIYRDNQTEQLRRKVERYYGLETGEVEIEFKGR